VNTRTIKRDSQNAKLLVHLVKGKPLTRLKAFHVYHVANFTARMSDLVRLLTNNENIVGFFQYQPLEDSGCGILKSEKVDPNGQSFASYSIECSGCRKSLGGYLSALRRVTKRAA
jgi:hypothetical protein